MSKKTRLMAGVAMPVLSLLWQPALAAPPMADAQAIAEESRVIRVQAEQPPILPPGAAPQEEAPAEGQKPKRRAQPEGADAPAREAPAGEAPRAPEPKAAEPKAAEPQGGEAEQPRPRREAPAAEPQAGQATEQPKERPRREAPAAGEQPGEARPARQPQANGEARPDGQENGERPRGEGRPRPERPSGGQAAEQPAPADRPVTEKPAAETPSREKPAAAEAPAMAPAQQPAEKPRAKPAEQPAEKPASEPAAKPAAKPEAPAEGAPARAAPEQAPAAGAPAANAPAAPPAAGAEPAARPPRPARPAGEPANGQMAPGQQDAAPGQPPAHGKPAGSAPPAGAPPAAGQSAVMPPAGAPGAPPRTPEEIERAKKIAENPAAATGPVVLPVENGAAILDSAKEYPQAPAAGAPPRDGQGRDQARGPREGGPRGGPAGGPGMPGGPQGGPAMAAPAGPPPPAPKSDADAQAMAPGGRPRPPIKMEAATAERGERLNGRPRFDRPEGFEQRGGPGDDNRVILQFDNRTIVRHDDSRRFYDEGYQPEYERLRGGRTREIIDRDGGVQIVTIRNRYGDIVQRSRIENGREYVLYYAPELMDDRQPQRQWRDPGLDLPPMRLTVPLDDYIIDTSSEPDRDYYDFLEQPPVERVERVYSLDEVRYSARIRDKVRRIDLDTITFATGSAEIPMNQASSLRKVADAIKEVLDRDPAETFLIEGHTDAVGSDDSNLVLSDRRAESVAVVLTSAFGIPPENLATQGYGERYLKVRTDGPSQENRRVTIRRITPLVKPVAQKR